MAGNSRAISAITVPLKTDVSGFSKGLKQAGAEAKIFNADASKSLGKDLFGDASKQAADLKGQFSSLASKALSPVQGLNEGIAHIGDSFKKTGSLIAKVAKGVLPALLPIYASFKLIASGEAALIGSTKSLSAKLGGFLTQAGQGAIKLGALVTGLAGVALGIAGATAALAAGGFKRLSEIGDAAQSIGIAADKLSELRFAAQATGTSTEDLTTFMKGLTQTVHQGIGVITPASEAFKRLGTSAEELSKMTPDQQIKRLVQGFESLPDAASKAQAAMDIAGESGIKVLKTLSVGTKGLDDLLKQSGDLGITVKPEEVAKIQEAQNALGKVGEILTTIGSEIAAVLGPVITGLSEMFVSFWRDNLANSTFFKDALDGLVIGIGALADVGTLVKLTFQAVFATMAEGIGFLIEKFGDLLKWVGKLVPGLDGVGDALVRAGKATADFGKRQNKAALEGGAAFNEMRPSEKLLKAYNDFNKVSDEKAKKVTIDAAATAKATTSNTGLTDSVAKLRQEFNLTISQAGLTAEMKQVDALRRQGAPLKDIIALTRQANEVREAGKRDSLAEDLRESTKLPIQKLAEDINRIKQLYKEGKISQAQAVKGIANKTTESGVAGGETKFSGALQANSTEGRSYLLSQINGRPEDALTVARKGVEATMNGNATLNQILGTLQGGRQPVFQMG